MTLKKNYKGFTLIELMVVMAIIAILSVLIIGAIQLARRTASETTNRSNARTIQTGMEAAFAKSKAYPVLGTSTTPVSFDTARTALSMAATSLASTCGVETVATGNNAVAKTTGGGQIYSTATTYVITPFNFECSAALGTTDVLTVN